MELEVKEWMELYVHSPNTPSWRGAQFKHRDSFTLPLSEYSLPCSQKLILCPCPEPDESRPISFQLHFSIVLSCTPRSPKYSPPFRVSDQNCVCISYIYAWLIPRYLDKEYKSWSSLFHSFVHASFTSSLIGPHILNTLLRFPAGAGNFSLHHRVQNGSGTNPASYPMGTSGSFPGGKAAGAWSWPLTSV
jgi:hypothetical protein